MKELEKNELMLIDGGFLGISISWDIDKWWEYALVGVAIAAIILLV